MSSEQFIKSEEQILVRNEIENTQEYLNTLEEVREKLLLLFTQTVNVNVKFENKNTIVLQQWKVFNNYSFIPHQYTKNQTNLPNEIHDIEKIMRISDSSKHIVFSWFFRAGKSSILQYLINHCSDSECQYIEFFLDDKLQRNDLIKGLERSLSYSAIQQRKHLVLCCDEYICARWIRDKLNELYDKIAEKYNCIVSVIAVIHQNYDFDLADLPEAKDGHITRTMISQAQIKEYVHEALFPFTLSDNTIQEMYQLYWWYYFPYNYLIQKLSSYISDKEYCTSESIEIEMIWIMRDKSFQNDIKNMMYKTLTI